MLAYNIFGRNISRIESELEGFAYDLRELLAARGDGSHGVAVRSEGPPRAGTAPQGASDVRVAASVGAP